ncbi:MAG: class II D-tagatose-bisphosphate aldolase, non-catalytic subunit [Bdellovibrionales bacterium]|nr:class II D-tagatose-bisphosphate aldolase, non-catalytic subunit [Bdellovibrionales bacterium]
MTLEQIKKRMAESQKTQLGIGPMSKNCVDVTVDLAQEFDVPLILIASRRQIEDRALGGGYVNRWSTDEFASYVRERDPGRKVILARDHGGPWQNETEFQKKIDLGAAMASAKKSYQADIDAGMQLLHIDPSLDPQGAPTTDQVLDRLFELYGFCHEYAKSKGKGVLFEIGTEEQSVDGNNPEQVEYVLNRVKKFCESGRLPLPTFMVVQTGTKVMEMRNIGTFEIHFRRHGKKLVELCEKNGTYVKGHNTDYLSDEALRNYPLLGIHAANVGPELGVTETQALIQVMTSIRAKTWVDQFLQLAFESKKFEKWMMPGTQATDREKSIICGHYVFGTPEFAKLREEAENLTGAKGISLSQHLKDKIRHAIVRYMSCFNLVQGISP